MKQPLWQSAVAQALIVALVSLLLSGASLFGALGIGLVPPFAGGLPLQQQHALIVRNGPVCLPELTAMTCQSGVERRELRIAYAAEGRQHTLVLLVWRK